jgi:hypothetical protein
VAVLRPELESEEVRPELSPGVTGAPDEDDVEAVDRSLRCWGRVPAL